MTTTATILKGLTALLVALQILPGASSGTPEISRLGTLTPKPVVEQAPLDIDVEDPGWTATIEWAVARYESVGLDLPAATVTLHDDPVACKGASGLYVRGDVPEIRLCANTEPDSRIARLIVLHELGHLWAEGTLTGPEKQALLDLRGLEVWADSDHPTHKWGAEHAAEILSWGLMDESVRIIRIYDTTPDLLTEAWLLLVGRPALTPAASIAPAAMTIGGNPD